MNRFDKFFKEQKEETLIRIKCDTEKHRKGTAKLEFTNKDGSKISDVKVRVKQTGHEFNFGCNAFMLDQFPDEEHNQMYREMFPKLFNYAIAPFYWSDFELTDGNPRFGKNAENVYRRPAPEKVLEYCSEKGLALKGHPLFWHHFLPDWLVRDKDESMFRIDKRFREISSEYADRIRDWDVVNESLSKSPYAVFDKALPNDYVNKCFAKADRYFPNNRLFINETTNVWGSLFARELGAYYMQIENMLMKGARIDGIGLQYHMFSKPEILEKNANIYFNPTRLFDVMDWIGKFDIPLHISEITVPAYGGTDEAKEEQAELTEWLYRIWFSHPNAEAIIWWNLVDGTAAYAPLGSEEGENYYHGGLLNYDMTEKPVYKVLDKLINHEWHTEEELSSENGTAKLRGFYGTYDIEVDCNGKKSVHKINFTKNGEKNFKIEL